MLNAFNAIESGANQIHAYMPTGAENGDTDVIQFGDFVISYVSREVSSICYSSIYCTSASLARDT